MRVRVLQRPAARARDVILPQLSAELPVAASGERSLAVPALPRLCITAPVEI